MSHSNEHSHWRPTTSSDTHEHHLIRRIGPWSDAPHAESDHLRPSFFSIETGRTTMRPEAQPARVWLTLVRVQRRKMMTRRVRVSGLTPMCHVTMTWRCAWTVIAQRPVTSSNQSSVTRLSWSLIARILDTSSIDIRRVRSLPTARARVNTGRVRSLCRTRPVTPWPALSTRFLHQL
jgi:hypothetical protein